MLTERQSQQIIELFAKGNLIITGCLLFCPMFNDNFILLWKTPLQNIMKFFVFFTNQKQETAAQLRFSQWS